MTITEILQQVRTKKACSVAQLRRYFKKLNIQPTGCRQKPQIYPDDAGTKILVHLGLEQPSAPAPAKPAKPRVAVIGHDSMNAGRVVSMEKLQTIRTGGKGAK